MRAPVKVVQVIIAAGIYSVWLVRPRSATRWRGGKAKTLKDEFAVYGLPPWFMWTVGTLKLGSASLLLAGLEYPAVTRPAALGMAALMTGAVSMHLKVRDPWERSLPALAMLSLSLYVARNARRRAGQRGDGQARVLHRERAITRQVDKG